MVIMTVLYIIFVAIYMISHRIWFSADQFFLVVVAGTLLLGRRKKIISDWGPFLLLLLGYGMMRSLIPYVTNNVHIFPMIKADQWLFGVNPTIFLQTRLFDQGHLRWYDLASTALYIGHFVIPFAVAYFLWLRDRFLFKKYSHGLLLLSYSGFATYLLFPAMPPWMASNKGYLPPLTVITGEVMDRFLPTNLKLAEVYSLAGANPVAAMPSLHAAWPFLIFLFLASKSKKLGLAFFPYVVGVWFSIVYLGEHYFIDAIVGALYALGAYWLISTSFLARANFLSKNSRRIASFLVGKISE